jgi:hypothetical protein
MRIGESALPVYGKIALTAANWWSQGLRRPVIGLIGCRSFQNTASRQLHADRSICTLQEHRASPTMGATIQALQSAPKKPRFRGRSTFDMVSASSIGDFS